EHLAAFLPEPFALRFQGRDRTLPVVRHLRGRAVAPRTLDYKRLAAEQCDQRRRAKAAKEEPRHTAHAHPGEERESDRLKGCELNALLREPRRHGIDQLAIQ